MPRARPCRCGFGLAMLVLAMATAGVTGCAWPASPGQPAVQAITTSPATSPAGPRAAAGPPAVLTPASASPDVTVAYAQHEVAVVGVATFGSGNQDAAPSTLWLSTDLRHWRNVTPAAARRRSAAGDHPFFEHASFLNPTTGWVTTYSPAASSVTVYATTDGGRSWIVVARGGHSMAAGSTELIQLLTAGVAFIETLEPTGPGMSLSSTSDGGRSWRVVYGRPPPRQPGQPLAGPFEMPMLFVSASHGFAADGIAPTYSFGPAEADFFMTTDGGRRWTRQSPPMDRAGGSCPPASTAQSSCMYAPAHLPHRKPGGAARRGDRREQRDDNLLDHERRGQQLDGGDYPARRSTLRRCEIHLPGSLPDARCRLGHHLVGGPGRRERDRHV